MPTPGTLYDLARACPTGRETALPALRRFSTWEVAQYMLPVAVGHLRRVLRETPGLPQGEASSSAATRWFTLSEVDRLRAHFATHGAARKGYMPPRPAQPQVVVCAGPAGAGRTRLALHLAVAARLAGRRVLAIDLGGDAAGQSLSRALGQAAPSPGALPAFARHHAEHLQAENRARLGRGERPLPLDETLARALELGMADLTVPTRWPGLDLVPAAADLALAEPRIAGWRIEAPGWPVWSVLADRLARDAAALRHDLVVIDTAAGLGHPALAALGAADLVLVPCRTGDPAATGAWLAAAAQALQGVQERHDSLARALGAAPLRLEWGALRLVIADHDDRRDAAGAVALQAAFGAALLPHRLPRTDLIGPDRPCFYDIDYREPGRPGYVALRAGFDAVYDDLQQVLTGLGRQTAVPAPPAAPSGR